MNKKNPFIEIKKDRRRSMLDSLMTPAITTDYSQSSLQPSHAKRLITVTLDKLRPYEGNPRKTKNPAYEEIKASIKARGLDHAPNITQRPGDDFYIIADGGNTRLQALTELFKETQDPQYWSIECVLKPWQGDAHDINSQLNMLIGHLTENDIRGELSFIEKSLGIRQVKALYEEKYKEFFSHRQLSEKLSENGYPISNQIIARMDQCLTYLYPHIPQILLNGLGKGQIAKLLQIHRNAMVSFDKYKPDFPPNTDFDQLWKKTLSPFDREPSEFAISSFQDSLIGNISEAFGYQISYDTLKIEIDLEEIKLKRLMDKQVEINQRVSESENRIQQRDEVHKIKPVPLKTEEDSSINEEAQRLEQPIPDYSSLANSYPITEEISVGEVDDNIQENPVSTNNIDIELENIDESELYQEAISHYTNLGIDIGINAEQQRIDEAKLNDLEFANVGNSPISNIWKIHPLKKHFREAFYLALEIAEEAGIAHFVHSTADYVFELLPLNIESPSELMKAIYTLLSALNPSQLDRIEKVEINLSSSLLLTMSDLMLVRIMRYIRLIRYIQQNN